jgi:hypothetical protein
LFSQSFRKIVETLLAASTASNANLACDLCFLVVGEHTHTSEHRARGGKIRRSKMFWERAEITVFVKNIGHYFHFFSLFNLQVK